MYSENIVVGAGTEYPLKGLILLPDDLSKPVPAVVMVHGSGPSNMDEKVMKLTPFKDLAEGLAEHGIASLRYDKRTFVHGRRMMKNKCLTVKEETIDDALLAVRMLKRDPRIDHDRIYILGHSMGAMLAPRIDAEGADVRGLIMMAGTPYRLEEIVLRQLRQAGRGRSILSAIVRLEYRIYRKRFRGLYRHHGAYLHVASVHVRSGAVLRVAGLPSGRCHRKLLYRSLSLVIRICGYVSAIMRGVCARRRRLRLGWNGLHDLPYQSLVQDRCRHCGGFGGGWIRCFEHRDSRLRRVGHPYVFAFHFVLGGSIACRSYWGSGFRIAAE